MTGARGTALTALLKVEVDAGYSNLVLDKALAASKLSGRDKNLASALFYGVLERRMTLDAVLEPLSKRPLAKLDPAVRLACRMGAYQIYYMDRVPDSAAVNESVELVRAAGKAKAAGFVNGVLRSLLRQKAGRPFPPTGKTLLETRAIRYSCPAWIIERWDRAYGQLLTDRMLESLFARPPLYARVNTIRTTQTALLEALHTEGVEAAAVPWLPDAVTLSHTGAVAEGACFRDGLFHIQDLSSQLCCFLLGPQPGELVYDVCAAPGGKTCTIAETMQGKGRVLAFDLYKGKVRLIRKAAQRLGLSNVEAAQRDAAEGMPLPPADRVLCDAPCSGLGILRRKPEIRYKTAESIDSLPDLQYRILCKSASLVRPGGVLVYSTCTLHPPENGGVAARFLRENAFSPLPLALPKGIRRLIREPENQLTLFPPAYNTDGFFISAFQKDEV